LKAIMAVNPRFYSLRMRHASFPELVFRIRQRAARFHLRLMAKLDGNLLEIAAVENEQVDRLLLPELMPEINPASSTSPDSWPIHPAAAQTDIRLRWEPARLQLAASFFAWSAQYPENSDCISNGLAARTLIVSWIEDNPFPRGEHYLSSMECALRIPVFFYALKRLDNLAPEVYREILQAIYMHAKLVSNHLSLYSSLGNHTVTEAVGLVFAGAVYRSVRAGQRWLETGLRILTDELSHQILDDGGPAEQSLGYHRFVSDLYWLAMDFIQKNALADVRQWQPKLAAAQYFLNAFQDRDGTLPSIGDSDDGAAVAPGISPLRGEPNGFTENHVTFPETGYSVINNDQLFFTFDHGPLGMPPFYNHGHADALAITLSKNGRPLIVDPGTYRYNGVPRWRRYFKSTRAHNTVTIDDQDQAIQETGFIWSAPYEARLTRCIEENGSLFYQAVHDGYMRLTDPVRHVRSVFFFDRENFLIRDRFVGRGMHCFQINFHLHPDARATSDGRWWVVDHGGESIFMRLEEADFQLVRGQNNPLIGWFSGRYGHKQPTGTLTCTRTGNADSVVFTTAVCIRNPMDRDRIDSKAGEFEK
jgi:hypothetical protein